MIDTIEKHKLELLITTPTFLRGFLRKAKKEQLQSLKMVVTGAEKLPVDLIHQFEAKFGIQVSEGYGMTEASPGVACNLPDEPAVGDESRWRFGTADRQRGADVARLDGADSRSRDGRGDVPFFNRGILWLRGANVFEGYLKDTDRTTEVLQDGWYKTGDVGRIDEEGFLFIEGRMSRFSKIAGEMVPHLTLEQKIIEIVQPHPGEHEGPIVVVIGVPDEKKGESLVVLSVIPIDQTELRKKMTEMGLPNLWIPKVIKRVEAIPLLATGKLDIRACQRLAAEAAAPTEASVAP